VDGPALLATVLGTGDEIVLRETTRLGQAVITDGGPARLFSPLLTAPPQGHAGDDDGDDEHAAAAAARAPSPAPPTQPPLPLPLMFYLPGLDGSGLAASNQFAPLSRAFELRCLAVPPADRMSFDELAAHVSALVAADVARDCPPPLGGDGLRRRPVYLLGESFGGVLALAVAERLGPALVDRLVLVNPATSFAESVWPRAGGLLAALPEALYRVLPLALSPVLANPLALAAAAARAEGEARELQRQRQRQQRQPPSSRDPGLSESDDDDDEGARDDGTTGAEQQEEEDDGVPEAVRRASDTLYALIGLMPQLSALRLVLPRATLSHRLALLSEGAAAARKLLPRVQQRALVLAGEQDLLLPSPEEAKRLERSMPRARAVVLAGRSHALLQEDGVDLVSTLREEGFYVSRRLFSSDGPLGGGGEEGDEEDEEAPAAHAAGVTARGSGKKAGLRGGRLASAPAGTYGTPAPIELPTPREFERDSAGFVSVMRRLTSPVFFSTDRRTGAVRQGLQSVPLGGGRGKRPVLLVGNHQLFAADMYGLVGEFLRERGTMIRGLAHPAAFGGGGFGGGGGEQGDAAAATEASRRGGGGNGNGNGGGGNPVSFGAFLSTYGAVPVGPFALHALLASGETSLLFPGGAREAFKRRGEEYTLIWPERAEFVRAAAKFGADIVPFAAVGSDDAVVQLMSGPEMAELRERVAKPLRDVAGALLPRGQGGGDGSGSGGAFGGRPLPVARKGVNAQSFDEDAFANALPLIAPNGPPRRIYFKFGAPIRTTPDMAKDKAACERVYAQTKSDVEGGLSWLLANRGRDPYADFAARVLWEGAPWNAGRQAPTFTP